jgi:Ni/Co efflux regulator RcnB
MGEEFMRLKTCLYLFVAAVFALGCAQGFAQDDRRDHDRDREEFHRDHDRDPNRDHDRDHFYGDHERDAMRGWYAAHHDHLPPGLRDRDHLPPGLERQLVVRGVLPVELRGRMHPCPPDLERQLPPPPPDCAHVLIGGHVVLMNRANFQVVDILHFEL